jgi:hypothetical protein
MTTFKKDPDAVLDYTFDWSAYLAPISDTIASATFVADTGLTTTNPSHTTTTATVFVSGGTAGQSLNLTCRIVTSSGRTDDRSVTLKIANR